MHSPGDWRPDHHAKERVAAVTSSGFDASRNLTERAARIAGLRSFETPTLEAVEHRRLQLWLLTLSLLFAAVVALVTVTFWHDVSPPAWVPPIVLQGGLLATVILFCAYAIEKELQLRRLTKLLIDERVLTAALTNRLREVSTLLEAAKAMNLVLDLEEVLRTILECANELLDTHDGSIMLVHGDGELRTVSASGSSGARGARLKFGEGVAGQVAQTREPVLVTGVLEPEKWPAGSGAAQPPTSSMSVPLVYRDVLLGVLNVNAAPGSAYTRHQLRALSLFGEQAAAAIANARLYEEQRLLASQNVYQALHDLLTNLPNRALFLDRVNHALSRRRLPGQLVAILFLDLDDFKLINDSLGHAAGDEVLIGFADRLRTCVRSGDAMARFGGDEFAVLIEDVTSAEDAAATAERILALFAEPFSVGERRMWLRASIGIAVEGLGASSAEALLRNADTAKNVAKTQGKGRIVTFEETMHADALQRLEFEGELQHALEHGQLAVHYQPMFSLAHGRAIGVEALVRWEHPARGLLPASAFLPLAEQAGLMVQIDRWVLRHACETLQALRSDVELPTGFSLEREHLSNPPAGRRSRGRGGTGPQGHRHRAGPARARDHRRGDPPRLGEDRRPPQPDQGARRQGRPRRFWDRLLVPVPPAALPGGHREDRPGLRGRDHDRQGGRRAGAGDRPARPRPQHRGDRRGDRAPGPSRRARRAAVPVRPGVVPLDRPSRRGPGRLPAPLILTRTARPPAGAGRRAADSSVRPRRLRPGRR